MSRLHFRDINDWTPASISIVDKPYHPLAVFEVYENDEEFIKKYIDPKNMEDEIMTGNNPAPVDDNITVSKSFFETLLDKVVGKSEPEPPANNDSGDDIGKQILEKLVKIEENQAKTDERLTALENPEPIEPPKPEDEGEGEEAGEGEGETNESVELPLNDDGTLDLENEVVAKYLPRDYTPKSQGVDPDMQRGSAPDKSFNARSGRDANGMSW